MVHALASLILLLTASSAPSRARTVARCVGTAGTTAVADRVAADIRPAALWDGRKVYPEFRAVDNPTMVPAARATYLDADEYVLGLCVAGQYRAYPTRFAAWNHIINDRAVDPANGRVSDFTVTYCVVCNTGICFDTGVKETSGTPLKFRFYGLYNGVLTMYDRGTHSVWLQVGGRAVKGPLLGATMKALPLLDTTWRRWRELHPSTLVMSADRQTAAFYEPDGTIVPRGYARFPAPYFRRTLTHRDSRLRASTLVLAVEVPGADPSDARAVEAASWDGADRLYRAYPLAALAAARGVVNDSIGALPVAALYEASSKTAAAYSRRIHGRTLTFETRAAGLRRTAVYDRETGSRWNIEGCAIAGPLKGQSLQRLDGTLSEWYGWAAYFPGTSIYGLPRQTEPRATRVREAGPVAATVVRAR